MPTFDDPLTDAAEASEAWRGLAHATRMFEDPADTYRVFGDLLAGVRSLRQVLDQLAATHLAHRDRAHDEDGDQLSGAHAALATADELHQAGSLLDQVHDRLDAAFSHSGRIAWHPEPAHTGMDHGTVTPTTVTAGSLRLAVWPDTPLGEHQRYAYHITDTTSGQELEGRDLFTGVGAPVVPGRAIRDLAGYLTAAGQARQYAIDHPGTAPENAGMFPDWVAEAAHVNADALTDLAETADDGPQATPRSEPLRRWISVVFLQGSEADEVIDLIDRDGTAAAIEHLTGWDYGDETTQAALVNGYVYDEPPTGALDRTVTDGGYALTYNPFAGHVSLLRQHNVSPEDALDDPAPASEAIAGIGDSTTPAQQSTEAPTNARRAPDPSWFAHPGSGTAAQQSRGLSL